MKIVIPGGSGQVGTILARAFHGSGDEVVVLSRRPQAQPWRVVAWDGATQPARNDTVAFENELGLHALSRRLHGDVRSLRLKRLGP